MHNACFVQNVHYLLISSEMTNYNKLFCADRHVTRFMHQGFFKAKVELHIMASAGGRAYSGVWGLSPQRGPGAKSLLGVRGEAL